MKEYDDMKKRAITWKSLSIMLALCLSLAGLAFAGEEAPAAAQDAAPEAAAEPETVVAAPLQLKTLGQESEDAFEIKITNNTGKDIEYFGVSFYDSDSKSYDVVYQMQEALIQAGFLEGEADGSVGPMTQAAISAYREANGLSADGGADEEMLEKLLGAGYDGNVMTDGDVFTAGETRILYVPKTKPEEETPAAASEEVTLEVANAEGDAAADPAAEVAAAVPEADALTEALKEFSLTPEYVISFRGKGETDLYYLFAFPAAIMQTAQLNLDGEIPYVMYTVSGSPEPASTLDAEKAASNIMYSAGLGTATVTNSVDQGYDQSWDTGYEQSWDTGYDTGYDAGYEAPVYEEPVYQEPVYEAPYIVTEEYYPSCDDGSHGVIYRVWSDGTEERIDY